MSYYNKTFMGHVGFNELRQFGRQATEFGREIVNILNERAQVEQTYAKALRRLGQKVSKATSLILVSPLSTAWKTVGVEMEKEGELHSELGVSLIDDCVQPLSMLTEGQIKRRRMMEQLVEDNKKKWFDKHEEHVKVKKRQHATNRENESLIEQIHGPRPKTDKDQMKLMSKQTKQEDAVRRADVDYYNSLILLERSRQSWEAACYNCCDSAEDMDLDRFNKLCQVLTKYGDHVYQIPSKMKTMCRTMDDACYDLSPSKEISIVHEKLRTSQYESEQILCDFYQEDFGCLMSIDRRTSSVKKLLERYISDCQKERSHNDGLLRLDERMDGADFSTKVLQSSAMLTFFEVIRYKLNCTLSQLEGKPHPTHPLSNNIEHHTDKLGIRYSILKLKPGESEEKMKNYQNSQYKEKSRSKSKSSKSHAPNPHSRHTSHRNKSDYRRESSDKRSSSSDVRKHDSSSSRDYNRRSSYLYNSTPDSPSSHSSRRASSHSQSSHHKESPQSNPTYKESAPPPYSPPAVNGSSSSSILCECIAIYDYEATREDELTIKEGDIIKVYEKGADDWWKGEVNGRIGLFPANYIDTEINV